VFLCFNTSIPSSAPVERLFISAALILSKKRDKKLSDKLFEQLLLLKLNKCCPTDLSSTAVVLQLQTEPVSLLVTLKLL